MHILVRTYVYMDNFTIEISQRELCTVENSTTHLLEGSTYIIIYTFIQLHHFQMHFQQLKNIKLFIFSILVITYKRTLSISLFDFKGFYFLFLFNLNHFPSKNMYCKIFYFKKS